MLAEIQQAIKELPEKDQPVVNAYALMFRTLLVQDDTGRVRLAFALIGAEMTNHETYRKYLQGWRDGASIKSVPTEIENSQNTLERNVYFEGYVDGQHARRNAADKKAVELKMNGAVIVAH